MSSAYVKEWVRQPISSSYHQEGGKLLVFSVVLSCLEGQLRPLFMSAFVTLCQEGLTSREVFRRLRMNQSDVIRTWGGTEIQELSMTCVAQAAQRLLLQLMTAT